MMLSPLELGEQIKTARTRLGYTQKQLADRAGIGKTAMFDLEHGNPGVRLNTLIAVLHELGLSLSLFDAEAPLPGRPAPPLPEAEVHGSATPAEDLPDHLL